MNIFYMIEVESSYDLDVVEFAQFVISECEDRQITELEEIIDVLNDEIEELLMEFGFDEAYCLDDTRFRKIIKEVEPTIEDLLEEEEIEQEDLEMFPTTLYEKHNYKFRVGDIVRISKNYPDYQCVYVGEIGSFDYGQLENGKGPTEAIRLKVALYISTTGCTDIIISTAPFGDTSFASPEEITEFCKALDAYVVKEITKTVE